MPKRLPAELEREVRPLAAKGRGLCDVGRMLPSRLRSRGSRGTAGSLTSVEEAQANPALASFRQSVGNARAERRSVIGLAGATSAASAHGYG